MTSSLHDGLAQAIMSDPSRFVALLAQCLALDVPAGASFVVRDTNLSTVDPTSYFPDGVLEVSGGKRRFAIIPEIQLRRDARKRATWLVYVAHVRARLGCDAAVVVVTLDERVAEWARQPITFGIGRGSYRPYVLGPSAVPVIIDPKHAVQNPTLALVSALAHAKGPPQVALDVADVAAHAALVAVDDATARLYLDLIHAHLPAAVRRALEDRMQHGKYEYQSEFARRYVAQGRAEGEAKGKAEGKAEGEAKGKAQAILRVLALRNVPVPPSDSARILACGDLAQLDRWLASALTATSAAELDSP
jgi:hypothetical protein